MTWLYVPETSSPSAQASEDLNLASCSPSIIGERLAEASATWRGKEQQPQAWSRRWKQGGFIRLLSGLTCSPSTLDHGVAQFISSLRVTPVRTTALPESAQAPMASGSLLPRSAASPKSVGLILSSERTSRGMRTGSLRPSSRHWKGWAIALRQEYSARPKPVTPCDASECSSWPSAKTSRGGWERDRNGNVYPTLEGAAENWRGPSDVSKRGGSQTPEKRMAGGHSVNLEDQAEHWNPQWPGPDLGNNKSARAMTASTQNGRRSGGGQSSPPGLEQVARIMTGDIPEELLGINLPPATAALVAHSPRWAAPAAQNHKGSSEGSIMRSDGKSREDILSYQAEQFFRPPSSPAQPIAGGSMSSTDSPNSNQPSVKRRLNPIFVEALMRWPTGLSGFERQEMAWTRWWLLMPTFLSALVSASEDSALPDLFGRAA